MTPNEYQGLALCTEPNPPPTFIKDETRDELQASRLMHSALGLCTETGELQDALKKALIYGKPLDTTNLIEEFGDLLWYIALGLDACGATLEDAMTRNIAKLRVRFGDRFSKERALNRDLAAEQQALNEQG